MSTENQQPQDQQNEGGKIAKRFDSNIKRVLLLLGGDNSVLSPVNKTAASELESIVAELTKEDRERAREATKAKLKALLEAHVKFVNELKVKKAELQKLEDTKKKEFNEAADKFFNSLVGEQDYLKELAASLSSAAGKETATEVAEDTAE